MILTDIQNSLTFTSFWYRIGNVNGTKPTVALSIILTIKCSDNNINNIVVIVIIIMTIAYALMMLLYALTIKKSSHALSRSTRPWP